MRCNLDITREFSKYPCTPDEHKNKRSIRHLINAKVFQENKYDTAAHKFEKVRQTVTKAHCVFVALQ